MARFYFTRARFYVRFTCRIADRILEHTGSRRLRPRAARGILKTSRPPRAGAG